MKEKKIEVTILLPESTSGEWLTRECSPHASPNNECTMIPGLKGTPSSLPTVTWGVRKWPLGPGHATPGFGKKNYPVLERTRKNGIKLPKTKRKVKPNKVNSFSSNQPKLDRNEDSEISTGETFLEAMKFTAVLELLWSVIYTMFRCYQHGQRIISFNKILCNF